MVVFAAASIVFPDSDAFPVDAGIPFPVVAGIRLMLLVFLLLLAFLLLIVFPLLLVSFLKLAFLLLLASLLFSASLQLLVSLLVLGCHWLMPDCIILIRNISVDKIKYVTNNNDKAFSTPSRLLIAVTAAFMAKLVHGHPTFKTTKFMENGVDDGHLAPIS